jgi:hypothetical protein
MNRCACSGCARYGRGRSQTWETTCARPSASAALKPAAMTPCRPFTDRHFPRARNTPASSATKKMWPFSAKKRSGSSKPSWW